MEKSETERVKEYLSEMVRARHRGQSEERIKFQEEVLFAILDSSSDVISEAIKDIPHARIFSRDDLRAFLASVVAGVILKAGKRMFLGKRS